MNLSYDLPFCNSVQRICPQVGAGRSFDRAHHIFNSKKRVFVKCEDGDRERWKSDELKAKISLVGSEVHDQLQIICLFYVHD